MNKTTFVLFCVIAWYSNDGFAGQSCTKDVLCVHSKKDKNQVELRVENKTYAPLTIKLKFTLTNMIVEKLQPLNSDYHGNSKTLAYRLKVKNPSQKWKWSYKYYYQRGALNVTHDDKYVYRLPYAHATRHKLTQSFNGPQSHYDSNQFGLDFSMPMGTRVHAAREGTVVAVKQDSNKGGGNKKFANDGNYVAIRHSDGTLGEYFHLKHKGALVKPGDYVKKGQAIGLSGSTGWSTLPHLHFSVHSALSGQKRISHPFKMSTEYGIVSKLKAGKAYRAVP